jgi:hypothetical protein
MNTESHKPGEGTTHRSYRPRAHGHRQRVATLLAVGLVVAGCSSGTSALGTRTATVTINGTEIEDRPRVRCQQVQWIWLIETLAEAPGFTAQVRTGATVEPRSVQFTELGGFTGGFTDVTIGSAEATVEDGTFMISGTAHGFYGESVHDRKSANFEIRTEC